ncbi:MAG: ABC transporter ATP-binding protein [Oscillospiraceae bacterium]|nr:ABC transporter ATP-binding protein [Oscillospiraceae bacterium]
MSGTSIDVKDLSFSYGDHLVLDGVSFSASNGELLCVLGPNGVGKSTLFNCILGLAKPQYGAVLLDGKPVAEYPARELALKIAYVPQSHAPTFNYSVFDMVLMGTTARVGGLSAPGAEQMQIAEEALERVGISHLRTRGYLQISGGERQLTLIARALAQNADVVIMDEPTANLDYGNQLRVLARVRDLTREGLTVIQSTHNPDHAFLFAARVLALVGGKVAADGKPDEVVTEQLIHDLYGVTVRLTRSESGAIRCEPLL